MNPQHQIALKTVRKMVNTAFSLGASTADVHDGEEWAVKGATNTDRVMENVAATDMESVSFFDPRGQYLGRFDLVWGNGNETVADHSDNEWCNGVWTRAGLGR